MKLAALFALLSLTACRTNQPTKAPKCPGAFPEYWDKASDPCHHCIDNRIKIDTKGTVFWNRSLIDLTTLDRYLTLNNKMDPDPVVVLDYPSGTPCKKVAEIRSMMEKRLECRTSRRCRAGGGPLGW
jgi:hypothetical protein